MIICILRDLEDWQGAYQIYSIVKVACQEGRFFDSTLGTIREERNKIPSRNDKKVKEVVKDGLKNSLVSKNKDVKSTVSPILSQSPSGLRVITAIPSIVYGQAVVTMAKGGAESQTFQIFCEMLEVYTYVYIYMHIYIYICIYIYIYIYNHI
jgi:hypothetical protein